MNGAFLTSLLLILFDVKDATDCDKVTKRTILVKHKLGNLPLASSKILHAHIYPAASNDYNRALSAVSCLGHSIYVANY